MITTQVMIQTPVFKERLVHERTNISYMSYSDQFGGDPTDAPNYSDRASLTAQLLRSSSTR
jgi:hypothetical protein